MLSFGFEELFFLKDMLNCFQKQAPDDFTKDFM